MAFPLNKLGETIFLDRYSLHDSARKFSQGDKVLVITDVNSGHREIGVIEHIAPNPYSALIRFDEDDLRSYPLELIERPLETPEQAAWRVAESVATVEDDDKVVIWRNKFFDAMNDWKFVPGGRIWAAAGNPAELTYNNCFVIPSPKDSRGGILDSVSQMAEIMSRGGGVGVNISTLRPKKAIVRGVNGRSSGSVSWGALYSYVTGLIEQGGSRRGALMIILEDWHPDIIDFINSKREAGKITNANISIAISDDFMWAVKNDTNWELQFPDTSDPKYDTEWDGDLYAWSGKKIVYKTIKARQLWNMITESAWASAEPGIWFKGQTNKYSNSYYYNTLSCTNPCAEEPLPPNAVCNLGAINLSKFVKDDAVNWDLLGDIVRIAVRFLDDVIDATSYPFPEQETQQKSERRLGLGTMGLADMLIQLRIRYGSPEAIQFVDDLYGFIARTAYLASVDLSIEKGSFPLYSEEILNSGYMKNMPQIVRDAVQKSGLRNVTILTQAPNGTTATMVN